MNLGARGRLLARRPAALVREDAFDIALAEEASAASPASGEMVTLLHKRAETRQLAADCGSVWVSNGYVHPVASMFVERPDVEGWRSQT